MFLLLKDLKLMTNEVAIEVTKRHLFSDSHRRYEVSNIPIEDCRF